MLIRFSLSTLLIALFTATSAAQVKVFILAGTSNMWGQGFVADVPAPFNTAQEDVLIWQDDLGANVGWTSLRPGFGATCNNFGSGGNTLRCAPAQMASGRCGKDEIGPELTLGRALADAYPNHQIALLKHAAGGTSMDGWNPDDTGPADESHMYVGLTEKMSDALMALTDAGKEFEVAGLFWEQGGGDGRDLGLAESYATNLQNFIATIRDDFNGGPGMPFVIGRSNSFLQTSGGYPYMNMVRDAQVDVANSDPVGAWINGDDLSRYPNDVHYDAAGQLELGRRFASAFLGIAAEPAGDFNSDGTVDAADYVVWRNGLGTTYTQDVFTVWRAHFGLTAAQNGPAKSNNVPEPTVLKLLVFAIAGQSARRQRVQTYSPSIR
jgi:hypothetical protein